MSATAQNLPSVGFDDSLINWRQLGDFEHFVYTIFDIDEKREIADFALKFVPNEPIFLHRHRAHTQTFVVEGEHRIYEPDGSLREVRPLASFTSSPASPEPHQESGGTAGGIVLYSTRGSTDGVVFDVLDPEQNTVGTLSFTDLIGLFELQGRKPGA